MKMWGVALGKTNARVENEHPIDLITKYVKGAPLGRGRGVVGEATVSRGVCQKEKKYRTQRGLGRIKSSQLGRKVSGEAA